MAAQQSRTRSCATSDRAAFLNVAPRKGKEHGLGGSDPTMDGPRFGMSLVHLSFSRSPSIARGRCNPLPPSTCFGDLGAAGDTAQRQHEVTSEFECDRCNQLLEACQILEQENARATRRFNAKSQNACSRPPRLRHNPRALWKSLSRREVLCMSKGRGRCTDVLHGKERTLKWRIEPLPPQPLMLAASATLFQVAPHSTQYGYLKPIYISSCTAPRAYK